MATQSSDSFADTTGARILALCLAACFALILLVNYGDDFGILFSGSTETALPVTNTETAPDEAANPALAECLPSLDLASVVIIHSKN